MINPSDYELAEQLRFMSDLYDIRILSEITGFNQRYLTLAENEWGVFDESSEERKKIMKSILPNFFGLGE